MNAPMYRELTGRELMLYKTGFKNGYRMSLQQNKAKIEGQLFKLKLKQQKIEEDKKNKIYALLKQEGADDTELIVFGYWMEGVKKPSEIAGDLGINIKEVYNSTKRIERRLFKIQSIIKTIV